MAGIRTTSGTYYVCGSRPCRKGVGCGPGVHVPKEGLEAEVVTGLQELLGFLSDGSGFAREVNDELRHMWETTTGRDPNSARRLAEVEKKIANTWSAIEDGLTDTATANARLRALQAERGELQKATVAMGEPPQIDPQAATAYQRQAEQTLAEGGPTEEKQVLRARVAETKLAPEALEVETTYQIPEPVMHSEVAGAGFGTFNNLPTTAKVVYSPGTARRRARCHTEADPPFQGSSIARPRGRGRSVGVGSRVWCARYGQSTQGAEEARCCRWRESGLRSRGPRTGITSRASPSSAEGPPHARRSVRRHRSSEFSK